MNLASSSSKLVAAQLVATLVSIAGVTALSHSHVRIDRLVPGVALVVLLVWIGYRAWKRLPSANAASTLVLTSLFFGVQAAAIGILAHLRFRLTSVAVMEAGICALSLVTAVFCLALSLKSSRRGGSGACADR